LWKSTQTRYRRGADGWEPTASRIERRNRDQDPFGLAHWAKPGSSTTTFRTAGTQRSGPTCFWAQRTARNDPGEWVAADSAKMWSTQAAVATISFSGSRALGFEVTKTNSTSGAFGSPASGRHTTRGSATTAA